jgi:class 3 adenylate cyclase
MRPIHYTSCTLVVMDLQDFTNLGTQTRADELVDILNAVFTAIDQTAVLIGKVWKVHTFQQI